MDRRSIIKNAGIAGVLAAGAAPAVHAQTSEIRWRLASSFPKALDTIFGAGQIHYFYPCRRRAYACLWRSRRRTKRYR